MDSPGHSAQYCTYTVMEAVSKDILASVILDKRMTDLKSTNMEREGLKVALRSLTEKGLVVREVVTDASTSIAAMMSMNVSRLTDKSCVWCFLRLFYLLHIYVKSIRQNRLYTLIKKIECSAV